MNTPLDSSLPMDSLLLFLIIFLDLLFSTKQRAVILAVIFRLLIRRPHSLELAAPRLWRLQLSHNRPTAIHTAEAWRLFTKLQVLQTTKSRAGVTALMPDRCVRHLGTVWCVCWVRGGV